MFRNRRNSQKPSAELVASFKTSYPNLGSNSNHKRSTSTSRQNASLTDALTDLNMDHSARRLLEGQGDPKQHGHDPMDTTDQWRLTPLLDHNSFGFTPLPSHSAGLFGLTPGATNAGYHSQAGDLHTPGLAFQLGTPLSMPHAENGVQSGVGHEMQPFQFLGSDVYGNHHSYAQQPSYAPSSFINHGGQFHGQGIASDVPGKQVDMKFANHHDMHALQFAETTLHSTSALPMLKPSEPLRFQVILNAPTAMIRHPDEIPLTYLNKGQAYSITITDSQPFAPSATPIKFRTVVRISFEDEQQRQKPATCWQLWKEGRGLAESHHRGGRLQAVEYVDPNQNSDGDSKRSRTEIEKSSFDSFSVTWSPEPGSSVADCSVAVRFNFLSTDFSHSKGVKGIPVRLCAKTEMISSGTPDSPPGSAPEVCYCKVKLFRDHGAERKLSNDVAHIKKTIDKLSQQISQAEEGTRESGKRKRSGSFSSKAGANRPSKVAKNKRTWSVSSQTSGERPFIEDDLHAKLASMQDMFTSTRPVSVLYLKGFAQDDPDQYPVTLPGQPHLPLEKENSNSSTAWSRRESAGGKSTQSSTVSPVPSVHSPGAVHQPHDPSLALHGQPYITSRLHVESDWSQYIHMADSQYMPPHAADPASGVTRIQRHPTDHMTSPYLEALGVDASYKPPPERESKPVACFYVLVKLLTADATSNYYRAVYLWARTVDDLVKNISTKCQIDPLQISRVLRVNSKGLEIVVDDDVVRELPEGQDMVVTFEVITHDTQRTEDGDSTMMHQGHPGPLEMRLLY